MVYVIAPVFGVLQHATAALCASKHIATVVREVRGGDGRLRGVVACAIRVELFKARFSLSVRKGGSKGAFAMHL